MKKIYAVLLSLLFIVSLVPLSSAAAYENTYKNTGDMAEDILGVARTQIGYMEGSLEGTVQGSNDCTKYGAWYGLNYNPWCAMFVSWCANQAGIPTSIIPSHASCDVGMNWFKSRSIWQYSPYYGGKYIPKISDIIYFGYKYGNDYDSTHVGIVYKVDSTNVYVIEGNSSAKVQTVSYKLSSGYILGYGTPKYTVSSPDDNPYPLGKYKVTATRLNVRKNPNADSGSTVIAVLSQGDIVEVTAVANEYWGRIKVSSGEGWTSLKYCEFVSGSGVSAPTYTVTFDSNGGVGAPASRSVEQGKSLTVPSEIPKRDGFIFRGWSTNGAATKAEYSPGDVLTPKSDLTLYAIWKERVPEHWNANVYTDVSDGAWYYDAVEYCYLHGFMTGTSADKFSPDMLVDRAQFVTIIAKICIDNGETVNPSTEEQFADVDGGSYYAPYVAWAKEKGIVSGDENGNFNPYQKLTREQLALMLWRASGVAGISSQAGDASSLDKFSDASEISSWAVDGVAWACTNGLLAGADGKLMPKDNATRSQTAQIVYRLSSGK